MAANQQRKRKRPNSNAEYRIIDEAKIQSLLQHHEFLIPTGGGVCATCRHTITNLLKQIPVVLDDSGKDEVLPSQSPENLDPEVLPSQSQENLDNENSQTLPTQSSTSTDSQMTTSNDSPPFVPDQELVAEKSKALNRLLELTNQDVRMRYQLTNMKFF